MAEEQQRLDSVASVKPEKELKQPDSMFAATRKRMSLIMSEIGEATTLVTGVSLLGNFASVRFSKLPSYGGDKLIGVIADILTESLGADYEYFKTHDKNIIYRRSGRVAQNR